MTTRESKGRFFLLNESIRIDSHNESNRIANWNALLTVCCFSRIQIGFTFLVPAHPGSPGQRAVKRVYVSRMVRRDLLHLLLDIYWAFCIDF